MSRYSRINIIRTPELPKLRYVNVIYPQIPLGSQDIYVYTTQGDRYDSLALTFYKDSSLWWIINRANPNQDSASLFPSVGVQLRIPAPVRLSGIISLYERLNGIT
jgi:hypothetical protein